MGDLSIADCGTILPGLWPDLSGCFADPRPAGDLESKHAKFNNINDPRIHHKIRCLNLLQSLFKQLQTGENLFCFVRSA